MHFPDARLENTISARMSLALKIREMKPRVVVLPYWHGRFIRTITLFGDGLRSLLSRRAEEAGTNTPKRTALTRSIYSSIYANVTPSFVVDISAQFERRMAALLSYKSQYGVASEGGALFPDEQEIRERLGAVARFYGNLVSAKYGEPFVMKETMLVEDVITLGGRSI